MNTDMLRNLLYEHRDSPDLLLEAYKRGCRDERAAARLRGENEIQRLTAILRRNEICTKCGETTFDGECQCSNALGEGRGVPRTIDPVVGSSGEDDA